MCPRDIIVTILSHPRQKAHAANQRTLQTALIVSADSEGVARVAAGVACGGGGDDEAVVKPRWDEVLKEKGVSDEGIKSLQTLSDGPEIVKAAHTGGSTWINIGKLVHIDHGRTVMIGPDTTQDVQKAVANSRPE